MIQRKIISEKKLQATWIELLMDGCISNSLLMVVSSCASAMLRQPIYPSRDQKILPVTVLYACGLTFL